jgi:hypothetical protein
MVMYGLFYYDDDHLEMEGAAYHNFERCSTLMNSSICKHKKLELMLATNLAFYYRSTH